ncbi:hypothetical protein MRX96_031755 [Rhipicephalus microplus]
MQAPEIPGVVDALDVVADADLSDDDDWSDEENEEEEEDEVLRDNFKPLHYQVSLIIGTLAIGVLCVVAICAVETSMESWNNSGPESSGKDELMTALQVYQTNVRAHMVLVAGAAGHHRGLPGFAASELASARHLHGGRDTICAAALRHPRALHRSRNDN